MRASRQAVPERPLPSGVAGSAVTKTWSRKPVAPARGGGMEDAGGIRRADPDQAQPGLGDGDAADALVQRGLVRAAGGQLVHLRQHRVEAGEPAHPLGLALLVLLQVEQLEDRAGDRRAVFQEPVDRRGRGSGRAAGEREGADRGTGLPDRMGPAGADLVTLRQRAQRGPARIVLRVAHEHRRADMDRGAAGTRLRPGHEAVERRLKRRRTAGDRHRMQAPIRPEPHHRGDPSVGEAMREIAQLAGPALAPACRRPSPAGSGSASAATRQGRGRAVRPGESVGAGASRSCKVSDAIGGTPGQGRPRGAFAEDRQRRAPGARDG